MTWVVNAEGVVTEARPESSEMNNASVEECMSSRIRSWKFFPSGGPFGEFPQARGVAPCASVIHLFSKSVGNNSYV
jgi:hypothetical protein